jgi:DNA-binding MarR family transcriptional regulator
MSPDGEIGGPHLGSMLRLVHQAIIAAVHAEVAAAGYDDVGRFHLNMFRSPTPDGLRPTEVAARLGITKQSVNDLLSHLEDRGYAERTPDPADGRARIIRLTPEGQRLRRVVDDAAGSAERSVADLLGPRRFRQLRASLETVVAAIAAHDLLEPTGASAADRP